MRTIFAAVAAVFTLCSLPVAETRAATSKPSIPDKPAMQTAIKGVAKDLCNKQVVILGEAGTHGDGATLAFKTALADRLIEQCGFSAVVFESSYYEFDHLQHILAAGGHISDAQVSAAIGGIWNNDAEMTGFIEGLTEKANKGQVVLAGMDDAWDMAGIPYTTDILPADLSARLPHPDADRCARAFHARIYYDYGEAGYGPPQQAEVLECLARVRAATPSSASRDLDVVDSLQTGIANDLKPKLEQRASQERAMYVNFRRVADRLPKHVKVIVWTATVHGAKQSQTGDGADILPMGGYVHRAYGNKAFALAFGAAGGTFGVIGQREARSVPIPPSGSLEAWAMAKARGPAVYLPPDRVRSFGTGPAALFYHTYVTRRWSDAVDGVVVFEEEVPAQPVPHSPS